MRALAITIGLVASLAGCGGKIKPVRYYEINYPPSVPANPDPLNVALVVRSFLSSHLYREDRIVYGSNSLEMGTYQNERWAEPPVEMLQNALVRGLRASGRFRSVAGMRSDANGDFLLTGHLYEFKELSTNGLQARLSYDIEMRDLKAARIVWTHAYNHDEPSAGKDVASVVAAMERNVQRGVQEIQAGLEEYFRAHPAP